MPVSTIGTNGLTSGLGVTASTLSVNGNNISAVNSLGFRNRIINGNMVIDQRNAGASVTVNTGGAFYPVDRFRFSGVSSSGVFTAQQITDAPTGFTNSVRVTVTTIDSSLSGSDLYYAAQFIEGFNTADLAWGSASAATVTLSFWAKSSVTGTFGGALSNNGVNRSYPFTYTINAANTWEQKTVTIAGDTTGTWATDNNTGIRIYWGLGVASGFAGTAGSWAASQLLSATGATNLMATNAATWQITGVQLEAGSVASPFERRDYGRELIMCQRYYWRESNAGGGFIWSSGYLATGSIYRGYKAFPTAMRAAPTFGFSTASNAMVINSGGGNYNITTFGGVLGTQSANIEFNMSTSGTGGNGAVVYGVNSNAAYIDFSAEL